MNKHFIACLLAILAIAISRSGLLYAQDDDSTRQILKQGLLGAGTGAIAAGTSGGNAGQGALIGAGTGVIGSALLDAITSPQQSQRRTYAAPPPDDDYYYADDPDMYYEEPAPQPSASQQILKSGLLGAGTGAIAAGASGGDAGKGALIGAGTGIIGNALLDTLTQQPQQRRGRVYRRVAPPPSQNIKVQEEATTEGKKKIVKKYDDTGKLISEEEIYY